MRLLSFQLSTRALYFLSLVFVRLLSSFCQRSGSLVGWHVLEAWLAAARKRLMNDVFLGRGGRGGLCTLFVTPDILRPRQSFFFSDTLAKFVRSKLLINIPVRRWFRLNYDQGVAYVVPRLAILVRLRKKKNYEQ